MRKSLTVVLGAGASYDCVSRITGVTEVNTDWRPPLTKDLFTANTEFNKILTKYPKVNAVSEIIRTRLKRSDNLEDILLELISSDNLQIKKQAWEAVFYLQELLWAVSDRYVISGGTKYDTLVRGVLTSTFDQVLFLTLNYDLLLDRAISTFDDFVFRSMNDYCPSGRKWSLLKVHGSVNWGRHLLNARGDTQDADLVLTSLGEEPKFAEEVEVMKVQLHELAENQRSRDGKMIFPAMALPARGEKSFLCSEGHLVGAKQFFAQCKNFLFIGFSGLDPHVLELFKDITPIEQLMIVNGSSEDGAKLNKKLTSQTDGFIPVRKASGFDPVFAGGFSEFMESPSFTQFIGS